MEKITHFSNEPATPQEIANHRRDVDAMMRAAMSRTIEIKLVQTTPQMEVI